MFKKIFSSLMLASLVSVQVVPLFVFAEVSPDPVFSMSVSATQDTYIDQFASTTNHGSVSRIDIRSWRDVGVDKNKRALVQFAIPNGLNVVSATMQLYVEDQADPIDSRSYSVYKILQPWVEGDGMVSGSSTVDNSPVGEATWATMPMVSSTPTATTVVPGGAGYWVSWNVTNDVKSFYQNGVVVENFGWEIKDSLEGSSKSYLGGFSSRSTTTLQYRPKLVIEFALYSGSISGKIFNDVNTNAIQDEGEVGLPGRVISIVGPVATTTSTSASGAYSFVGIPSGAYTVCQLDSSWSQTTPASGSICPNNQFGYVVNVNANSNKNKDFGVFQGGSVKVILNTNPTLTEDSFLVALMKDNATTTTHTFFGPSEYVFNGVVPGEYSLSQSLPAWWAQSGISCISGESETTGGSLSVFADQETVCTISDVKTASLTVTNYIEPVQGTYSFTLSLPSDIGDTLVFDPVALGNAESHMFTGILPGTYNLLEIIDGGPSGETAVCFIGDTVVDPRVASLTIPAGARIQCTYNHGAFAVVQGTVFDDARANGVQDAEDTALSGWNIKLFKITEDIITSGEGDSIISTPIQVVTEIGSKITTGAGYVFGQLNPGIYKVCQVSQSGWTQSFPVTGEDCSGSLGHFVTLSFGDVITKHFGNFSKGSVLGLVFSDINNNGVQDEGELGLANIPVRLGSVQVSTNTQGEYQFADITPGTYTLTVDAPAHSSYSVPLSGNYSLEVLSGGSYVHKDFGIFTDTDTPSLPVHLTPLDGAVVRPLGLILDWSDSVDPSLSGVVYHYQSALSNATTTGNALSTPIYSATLSTSQIDASGTSEGTYFWQVKACDTAHNCTEWTNPWSLVVDTTAPVSSFTSPNPDSNIEDEFITIAGSTTDLHNVASTTLEFAPYTASVGETPASCGAYTTITSLVQGVASTTFNWSYNWTPAEDGVYCLTAHGQDEAGNTEASPFITNITFKKKVVTTTGGGGTSTGGGSSGGNGPIVGSFGGGSSSNGGSTTVIGTGGSPDGAVLPTTATSPEEQSTQSPVGSNTYAPLAFSGNTYTGEYADGSGLSDSASASTTYSNTNTPDEEEGYNSNLGAVGVLGEWNNWYWLWILIVLLIIAGVYYSTRERNK